MLSALSTEDYRISLFSSCSDQLDVRAHPLLSTVHVRVERSHADCFRDHAIMYYVVVNAAGSSKVRHVSS